MKQAGAWYSLVYKNGKEEKFQAAKWTDKLKDKKFKNRVLEIMDEDIIMRVEKKEGKAKDFYYIDQDPQ